MSKWAGSHDARRFSVSYRMLKSDYCNSNEEKKKRIKESQRKAEAKNREATERGTTRSGSIRVWREAEPHISV